MASAEETEIWECPICNRPLESPTQLPCGGVFCLCHLDDFVDRASGELDCPGCLGHHKIPHEGISGFIQIDKLCEELDVFEKESGELRDVGESMRITAEEHREKVLKDMKNINHHFNKVIKCVECRRYKVLNPYIAELNKLREMENSIYDITNPPLIQYPEYEDNVLVVIEQTQLSMKDKIKMAGIDLIKLKELLNKQIQKWDDIMCPIIFKSHIPKLYDLIDSYGQIDHYANYKIKTTVDGGEDEHKFENPCDMAVDPSTDNVYMTCDYGILELDNEGKFIKKTTMKYDPHGITVDSNRRIIITDTDKNKFYIHDHNLKLIKSFGKKGSKNGQFYGPCSVVCDVDDNIYIADAGNYRIQVFNSKGKFIRKFGLEISFSPYYLQISSDQKLLVSEYSHYAVRVRVRVRVRVYKLTGEYEGEFGGELLYLTPLSPWSRGITIDDRGFILVGDKYNDTIKVFTPDFIHFTTINYKITEFQNIVGNIAITKSGSLFMTSYWGNTLQVLH